MQNLESLFRSITIGPIELQNRIVMPPMVTGFGGGDWGASGASSQLSANTLSTLCHATLNVGTLCLGTLCELRAFSASPMYIVNGRGAVEIRDIHPRKQVIRIRLKQPNPVNSQNNLTYRRYRRFSPIVMEKM